MNEPTFVEASRKLAERMLTEGGETDDARVTFAFRLVTSRAPTSKELLSCSVFIFLPNDRRRRADRAAVRWRPGCRSRAFSG